MSLDARFFAMLLVPAVMKTKLVLATVLGVFFGVVAVMGEDPCPTPTPPEGPTPPQNNPPDPAFMNNDPRPEKVAVRQSPQRTVKEAAITEADRKAWQELYAKMEKNPGQSFALVEEVWRQNRPKELQRLAIVKARTLVDSTDAASNLDFMLACLEDPEARRSECLKLGRGNGLERDMASRRLVILEANPHLQLKLNN